LINGPVYRASAGRNFLAMKFFLLLLSLGLLALPGTARDYPASLFDIRSDGVTLNTRSIQFAIDYIRDQGGGRLVFSVGRYLTGSIHLRSGVALELKEGAVLLGSLNPFDYDRSRVTALIFAEDQHDIAITGMGMIDGQGRALAAAVIDDIHKGLIKDWFRNDRPEVEARAQLIYCRSCRNVVVRGITLRNSASWVETYDQCVHLQLDSIHVDSKAFWNNDGIDIVDCDSVAVTHSYIDAADDGICLKSVDSNAVCRNVEISDNVVRSSANAIKFGTTSYGGFRHIRIIHNQVFDTYRSAIALEAVDGGYVDDVVVDGLEATNTGNAIFLRVGHREKMGKRSTIERVEIRHVDVQIAAGKPDAGYAFEGPIEDMPRNISPMVIAGLPDALITDIRLDSITVSYPGGANPFFARVGLDDLDKVPERPDAYPDFSMFRELPAWGIYIRHARDIRISGLNISCRQKDYRTAVVLDDVHEATFTAVRIREPEKKNKFYIYRSSGVVTP
jgi:hypothetical protein